VEPAPRSQSARRLGTFLLKLAVVLLLAGFVLGLLSFLPQWADIVVTVLLAAAALAAPWRPFWRREMDTAKRLRRTSRGRLALAWVIALGGPVFCIAADYWFAYRHPRYADGSWLAGPGWDVLIAAPFFLLAVLVRVTALSRPAAVLAAVGLGVISALSFWAVATSDSSTAAVGFLIPWLYGFPAVVLVYVLDAGARSASRRLTAR
jgi:hypothetical protein